MKINIKMKNTEITLKTCFKCGLEKKITSFYTHKQMKDGHLNKCSDCTKKDSKSNHYNNSNNPLWVENERERAKEKYNRLNYKDKYKLLNKNKPWKSKAVYKNLRRNLSVKYNIPYEYELHHWSYVDSFLEDVVVMTKSDHRRWHSLIYLDIHTRVFKVKSSGQPLSTKMKHLELILENELSFYYLEDFIK